MKKRDTKISITLDLLSLSLRLNRSKHQLNTAEV